MRLNIYVYVGCCFVICYNQCDFANALTGINVRLVEEHEFPSVASIVKIDLDDPSEFNHFCTGVLITNRDVLTAEHCLEEYNLNHIRVIIGSVDIRNGRKFIPFRWTTYSQWAQLRNIHIEFTRNDVAILKLSENVPYEIKPAVLSNFASPELYGLDVVIASWGSADISEPPILMETVSLKLLKNRECENRVKRVHGKRMTFHVRILCTVAIPPATLTNGDSGGPLFYNNTIIGVNFGTCLYKGQPNHPGKINLHTGTDYYRDFIVDYINNL